MKQLAIIWTLAKKEITLFFSSLIAYLVIAIFTISTGLFLWIFPGNLLEGGFSDLTPFFEITPYLFFFLIPAITMRSLSEEFKLGTFELLLSRPLLPWHVILGKFLGALLLLFISLLLTFIYYGTLIFLGDPTGNMDHGATWGSYLGLFFLGITFTSIGIFASAISPNQIISFLLGAFLSFLWFSGFEFVAELPQLYGINDWILQLGLLEHYRSLSKGIVDSKDILFFLTFAFLHLYATEKMIQAKIR
jgi:ABC-2 type transport system permease protein